MWPKIFKYFWFFVWTKQDLTKQDLHICKGPRILFGPRASRNSGPALSPPRRLPSSACRRRPHRQPTPPASLFRPSTSLLPAAPPRPILSRLRGRVPGSRRPPEPGLQPGGKRRHDVALLVHAAAVGAPPGGLRDWRHRLVQAATAGPRPRRGGGHEEVGVVGGGRGDARDRGWRAASRALRHPAGQPP